MSIDLHGYQLHEAWQCFRVEIDKAYFSGRRSVVVITGQGIIMQEFPTWASNHHRVREITQQKHNPGSFLVKLKKVKK
jgi:DNA-nicking Smr family endonuclease